MAMRPAVNRMIVGSSPTAPAIPEFSFLHADQKWGVA